MTTSPTRRLSTHALCALFPGFLLLVACHASPRFTVTDVAMTGESDEAYVLTFTLLGENPGDEPLPLRRVSYSLTLDETPVFSGTRLAQATLPAHGAQAITLPVSIPAEGGAPPLGVSANYRISGSVEYLPPGSISELLFDSRLRIPTTGFGERGAFEFSE